jgi:endo-1,4-beta-xylanase
MAITDVPTVAVVGTDRLLDLSGIVRPSNATNKTIVWSVANPGSTGAAISGNTLTAASTGTVTVSAAITDGKGAGNDHTQNFTITVNSASHFIPVTGIAESITITAGTPLNLTEAVKVYPSNASNKTPIEWSVFSAGTTGASITNGVLSVTGAGTVSVKAVITNGEASGKNYTGYVNITVQPVAVTGISGVPAAFTVGTVHTLTGTVNPSNATNKTIRWRLVNAGSTGAQISNGSFLAASAGAVTVSATITDGTAAGTPYTQNFTITVQDNFVAVAGITDVPAKAAVGTPLTLTGTINPSNATNKTIVWSIHQAGNTGAAITGNVLTAANPGSVIVKATVINGKVGGDNFEDLIIITAEESASTLADERIIRPGEPDIDALAVTVSASKFTAGPNPASKSSGKMEFYRVGKRVNNAELRIYDVSGNIVNRVRINDNANQRADRHPPLRTTNPAVGDDGDRPAARRIVGSWDLKDTKGRPVPEGTYLVFGTLFTIDGERERISLMIGVR